MSRGATEVMGQVRVGSKGCEESVKLVWDPKGSVASGDETGGAERVVWVEPKEKERHQYHDCRGKTRRGGTGGKGGSGWRAYHKHRKHSGKSRRGQQTQAHMSAPPLTTHTTLGKLLDFCKPRVPPHEMTMTIKATPPAAEERTARAASTGTGTDLAVDRW